jgi:hypothetical protein
VRGFPEPLRGRPPGRQGGAGERIRGGHGNHRKHAGRGRHILLAFQAEYRLPERFSQILAEAADYARLAQTQESQQIAGALGVLTILGPPLSTALSVLQVLGDSSGTHLLVAPAAALAATAAALTTRYGRLVLSSLRGGPRGGGS